MCSPAGTWVDLLMLISNQRVTWQQLNAFRNVDVIKPVCRRSNWARLGGKGDFRWYCWYKAPDRTISEEDQHSTDQVMFFPVIFVNSCKLQIESLSRQEAVWVSVWIQILWGYFWRSSCCLCSNGFVCNQQLFKDPLRSCFDLHFCIWSWFKIFWINKYLKMQFWS